MLILLAMIHTDTLYEIIGIVFGSIDLVLFLTVVVE
jgi:hypothetical protein